MATRSNQQAEVGSAKTLLKRLNERSDPLPERLTANTAYGTGPLLGQLVDGKNAPHISVLDKSNRNDRTWTWADFEWDGENDQYVCLKAHALKQFQRLSPLPNRGLAGKSTAHCHALKKVRQIYPSKAKCCPNADAGMISREKHEDFDKHEISMLLR